MLRLRDLSIRSKVLLIIATGIVFQVIISGAGLYYQNASADNFTTTVSVDAAALRKSGRVRADFLDMIVSEKNIIMSQDDTEKSSHLAAFDAHQRGLDRDLHELEALVGNAGKKHIDEFIKAYNDFMADHLRVRELNAADEKAAAMKLSAGIARKHSLRARDALVDLRNALESSLAHRNRVNQEDTRTAISLMVGILLVTVFVAMALGLAVTRAVTSSLGNMAAAADSIASGNLNNKIDLIGRDEVSKLASAVDKMQSALRTARKEGEAQSWVKTGVGRLNEAMRGDLDVASLASKIMTETATYLDAEVGTFYILDEEGDEPMLALAGSYAYTKRKNLSNVFKLGEGIIGQAALEKQQILIRNVPDDYIRITSGLGEAVPKFIFAAPFLYDGKVKGVLEVGTLTEPTDLALSYISQVMPSVAITVETAQRQDALAMALQHSRQLAESLQTQQEELKTANEELAEQTMALKQSEERLKAQQEELEVVNEELEEKNELLEHQTQDVEKARLELAEKARDLESASKYKSDFLANMSHELRTPLNSLLILARVFSDNRDGNLSAEQVESARVIYNSGNDLLGLINDILDLAKIEAGRMELQIGRTVVRELTAGISENFRHMAQEKGISLDVSITPDAPEIIFTDKKRLDQIIKNLVSNALKFTEQGGVTVSIGRPAADMRLPGKLSAPNKAVAIRVRDTGIGIEKEKQKIIFEAFQQADGGTSRKFGGTGLGLSITRELVRLLGGEILLESEPERGSTFTVILPTSGKEESRTVRTKDVRKTNGRASFADSTAPKDRFADDRDFLSEKDTGILIVDDDPIFANLLAEKCLEKGFKSIIAFTGEEGLKLVETHSPKAIILDIRLPGMDGWSVLEMLKDNPRTRHIPVHIMSVEDPNIDALKKGAVGFLTKTPDKSQLDEVFLKISTALQKKISKVLVVEDNPDMRRSIVELIGNGDVHVDAAASGQEAVEALRAKIYDCMVLDLGLPDMDGTEVLRILAQEQMETSVPPVVVYTGRDITRDEELELRHFSESIIIKDVRSEERLMDEVSLFLHRVVSQMPDKEQKVIAALHDVDRMFKDKKVLIADDDMRTVFALSKILTAKGMKTLKAENGEKAIQILRQNPDVDLVLMDIMMPVMDGYETMRQIRAEERFKTVPIIALTAKAMKGDQDLCIQAGASDYLPKPLDENRLYSMMRVWLYR